MKKLLMLAIVFIAIAAADSADNDKLFKKLYVLEGTWKMNGKRGAVYEEWKKVDKNLMTGRSYFKKGADTVVNENIMLSNTKAGIFYTPTVEDQNNKQPIAFKMTKAEDNRFVFENLEHDFPKRIIYRFVTTDSLHAIVDDGTETGKKQNFYFKRH